MIRYFFHLRRGQTFIDDWEGDEFENTEAATAEAVEAARELVIASIRSGHRINGDKVEIWSEDAGQVGEVLLADLIPFHRPLPDAS